MSNLQKLSDRDAVCLYVAIPSGVAVDAAPVNSPSLGILLLCEFVRFIFRSKGVAFYEIGANGTLNHGIVIPSVDDRRAALTPLHEALQNTSFKECYQLGYYMAAEQACYYYHPPWSVPFDKHTLFQR